MFRLAQKERWVELPHGVRLRVAPITTIMVAAAQAAARKRVLDLLGKEEMPEQENLRRGVALMLTIQALGRECIRAWENVVDEEGAAVPITPGAIEVLLSHEEMAFAFFESVMNPLQAVQAEGNASGPAPHGTAAAGRNTAEVVPVLNANAA
jgi:urease accessory protein UreF